jgi:hypothetical protein
MKTTKLRIDGQFFHVEPDEDTELLSARILEAARTQAEWVTFRAVRHGEVTVLVAPGMSARFEVREIDDGELEEFRTNPPAVDFDAWLDWPPTA